MKALSLPSLSLVPLMVVLLPLPLWAEEKPTPPADKKDEELDTLVVTAEREEAGFRRTQPASTTGFRAKPIIDTPFSVSSFPKELIKDQQARTLLDVTKNDPSISQAGDPIWFDRINVRGFYLSVDAVYRDGLAINDQGNIALENKEAIEVTKGPSATRNGASSPGGTVNYVLKRPTEEPITSLTTGFDGFGSYGAHADLSRRFGSDKRFGARVNIAGEEIRSFIDEVEGDKKFFSSAFDWRATEKLLLEVEFEHQDREILSAQPPGISSFANLQAARNFFPRLDAETRPTQSWATEPNVQTYYSGRATYELTDDWRLKIAAQEARLERDQNSVRAVNIQPNGDYDISHYYSPDQERNNTSWQAILEGDFKTGALRHEAAFGYNYTGRDMIYGDGFSGTIGTGNLFDDSDVPESRPPVDSSYLANRNEQHALFFSDTIHYSEWLQVFGGARYTQIDIWNGDASKVLTKSYDKSEITPTVGVVYKPIHDLSLYTSYAEGIEQGGTAPLGTTNQNQVFDPLMSEQTELGAKYELPGGALLTAALFRIDKGLQYTDIDTNTYVQDGRQVHEGAEITLGGSVTPRLRMIAGIAYLNAEIEKTANAALVGKQPQGVPDWQANLFADYNLSDFVEGLSINGGIYYAGEKAIDPANTWMADDYVRFDAGVRYQQRLQGNASATYRLTVENLADKRYLANTSGGTLNFGAPRTLVFSATLEF